MIPVDSSEIRATGHWVEFEGRLYPAVELDSEFYVRWFGDHPPGGGWRLQHHDSELAERPPGYAKVVSAKDVTRFVRLDTEATWEGRRFDVMGFDAQGYVFLAADVPREIALALVAGKHSWEMFDRSSVSGRVPVSDLTDVSQ
ncbi:hypothetical protein [Arthrobacter pityocampae]|uniref:hypothetical protein n=1 Tax=Arthrobacter pityocampae TaxID=547334 RepID=UPI0011B01C05|nr:hypothetical protein [Arthrobacter pityocampae]